MHLRDSDVSTPWYGHSNNYGYSHAVSIRSLFMAFQETIIRCACLERKDEVSYKLSGQSCKWWWWGLGWYLLLLPRKTHCEVEAYTRQDGSVEMPPYNLPSRILFKVVHIQLKNGPFLLMTMWIPSKDLRRKDDIFVGQSSIPHEATPYPTSKEGSFCDLNKRINCDLDKGINRRAAILHEELNFSPELSNGGFAPNQKMLHHIELQRKDHSVISMRELPVEPQSCNFPRNFQMGDLLQIKNCYTISNFKGRIIL